MLSQLVDSWVGSSHSNLDPNFGFIESLYHTCATTLQRLWKFQSLLSLTTAQQASLKNNVVQLSLWEENFPSCRLDTILGHSNYLRIEVLENLFSIGKILMHYRRRISAHLENGSFTAGLEDINPLVEKAAVILSENDTSDSSTDSDTDSDTSSISEAEGNQQGRLRCYIACLLELGPAIEKQIANIQFKLDRQALPAMNPFSLSEDAQPFAIRIKDRYVGPYPRIGVVVLTTRRFKDAKVPLVERLAEANWERSVRLMTHAEEGNAEDQITPARSVPATAMTLFKPFSIFHDSGLGTSVPSRSHYAATVASHSSYITVAAEEDEGRPRVPSLPPEGLNRQNFQCPFCSSYIKCRDRIEWKMHVFADLQAYVCTHDTCKDALRTFKTRKEWADHEFKNHLSDKQWTCSSCSMRQDSPGALLNHLRSTHSIELREPRLKFELSRAENCTMKLNFNDHACPLCLQSGWQTMKAYATHVGRHLEEISLACLPKLSGDNPESDSNVSQKSLSSVRTASDIASPSDGSKIASEKRMTKANAPPVETLALNEERDEYIPIEFDEAGEKKIDANGYLNGDLEYRCRTFTLPLRGKKLFMLAIECARVLSYVDSYQLFNENRSLYRVLTTQIESDDLAQQDIIPFSFHRRQIAVVSARSMFRQFGSRIIINGRRVRDDYWESQARMQGFTEDDRPDAKRPGGDKTYPTIMERATATRRSTFFVSNVHCSSCVAYITQVLSETAGVADIAVSIFTHEVHVLHTPETNPCFIARALIQAAFEVHHFTTRDPTGIIISNHDMDTKSLHDLTFFSTNAPSTGQRDKQKHVDNYDTYRKNELEQYLTPREEKPRQLRVTAQNADSIGESALVMEQPPIGQSLEANMANLPSTSIHGDVIHSSPLIPINEGAENALEGTYETDDSGDAPIQSSRGRIAPAEDVHGTSHETFEEYYDEPIQSSRVRASPATGVPEPPPGSPENSDDETTRHLKDQAIEAKYVKKSFDDMMDDSDEAPLGSSGERAKYQCLLCENRPQFTTSAGLGHHINHHFPQVLYQCQMCKAAQGQSPGEARPKDEFISHMGEEHDIQDITLEGRGDYLFKTLLFEPPKTCPYDFCDDALASWDELWDHCQAHTRVPDPGEDILLSWNNPFTLPPSSVVGNYHEPRATPSSGEIDGSNVPPHTMNENHNPNHAQQNPGVLVRFLRVL
ncbi:chromatin remodelling complex Rsc7/Swp82 subunit-domain-containing protein [Aspergillus lucknowensis]|uniref:Chromatin remodelling complex Rsc7/Swp82 subunit-domain-containing protein n=1 Tax=Aspergillus lucknowensis TaxID=176173 RepID=A0ABR4LYP1_9EURO